MCFVNHQLAKASSSRSLKANTTQLQQRPPQRTHISGRWTNSEHEAFLRGLHMYGREWKKVATLIPTRTSAQVRSHAQKYLLRTNAISTNFSVVHKVEETSSLMGPLSRDSCVQRNVERLLADPTAFELEVVLKVLELRKHYRKLQMCLERQQRKQVSALSSSRKRDAPSAHGIERNVDKVDFKNYGHTNLMNVKHKRKQRKLETKELTAVNVLGGLIGNIQCTV